MHALEKKIATYVAHKIMHMYSSCTWRGCCGSNRCGSTWSGWRRWSDSTSTVNVVIDMEDSKNVGNATRDVNYQTEIAGGIKNEIMMGISD